MLIITPDIINNFIKLDICKDGRFYDALNEHGKIFQHIVNQNSEAAAAAMEGRAADYPDLHSQFDGL